MKNINTLALGLIITISCTSQRKQTEESIKEYYFPYQKFSTETTYCFVNKNDTTEKSYWTMELKFSEKDTLFCTTIFDTEKRKSEYLIEKINRYGTEMIEYTLFKTVNNQLSAKCHILESKVFIWNMALGEEIGWNVEFSEFTSNKTVSLTKRRTFTTIDSTNYTARFRDKMTIQIKETNQNYSYWIETLYKKNLGLINYKITTPDGKIKDFHLIDK